MVGRSWGGAGILAVAVAVIAGCGEDEDATIPGAGGRSAGGQGTGGQGPGGQGTGGQGTGGAVIPEEHPRIYWNEANLARLRAALDASTAAATRFRDMVDAQLGGADFYGFAASDAAMLGVLTGDAAYCDYAIGLVDDWVIGEEALIAAGERAEVAADSYLAVGEHVGGLSLVLDWCFAAIPPAVRARWIGYANQAVWNVWHPEEAAWGGASYPWSGWSTDNPANNYYYSFLRATMLLGLASLGENSEAQQWLDRFRTEKIQSELVPTFTADLVGGGSREGTGYGVAMMRLYQLYDLWEATTGERIWDLTPHTAASLPAFLHVTVPTLDRIAPIGDHSRDSSAALFDYHRAYVLALQYLLGAESQLSQIAQSYLDGCSVPAMQNAFMFADDFLYYDEEHAALPLAALHRRYYAPGTGLVTFRSGWEPDASWGAFIAGPYTESHAHRDQGSLLVYRGDWLAHDQNLLSHSGIVQDERAHNLVRIEQDGAVVSMVPNGAPAELVALRDNPELFYLSADVAPVYGGAAGVSRLERELVFLDALGVFVLFDRATTDASAAAVWTLNGPAVSATGAGHQVTAGTDALDVRRIHPASAESAIVDWTTDADMNGGARLDVRDSAAAGDARFLFVLAPAGTVESTSAIDAGNELGVGLDFTNGAHAELRFDRDAAGVTVHYLDPSATVLFDGVLAAGLDELPLLDER